MRYGTKMFDDLEVLVCATPQELKNKILELSQTHTIVEIQYASHRQEQHANWFTALVMLKKHVQRKKVTK